MGQAAGIAGTGKDIAESLPETAWRRLSAGDGTKGERLHDWAYLDLADLDASEYGEALTALWTRGLLIRRNTADGDLAYFSTWCPKGKPIETLARIEGHRWAIEDSFETAKNELGLDHSETRSWHGWHRHVSLVMFAFAATQIADDELIAKGEFTEAEARKREGLPGYDAAKLSQMVDRSSSRRASLEAKAASEQQRRAARIVSERAENEVYAQVFGDMGRFGGINRIRAVEIPNLAGDGTRTLSSENIIDAVIDMKEAELPKRTRGAIPTSSA